MERILSGRINYHSFKFRGSAHLSTTTITLYWWTIGVLACAFAALLFFFLFRLASDDWLFDSKSLLNKFNFLSFFLKNSRISSFDRALLLKPWPQLSTCPLSDSDTSCSLHLLLYIAHTKHHRLLNNLVWTFFHVWTLLLLHAFLCLHIIVNSFNCYIN